MKATIFVAALALLFSVGCTSHQNRELTQQQKDQIKSEVKAVGDSLMARYERLDITGAFQFYANSPDWVMANADGSHWDYETTRRAFATWNSNAASYKYTTISRDFMVVSKDIVVCTWVIKDEGSLKSGPKVVMDPHAFTEIFKRIAGQWKVVWSEDSGTPT
jgi:ketosteroid isomerase-like protein